MTIAVRPYLPDDLSRILDLYNALVVGRVPHCWPVTPASLDGTLQAGEVEREETRLLEQAIFVSGSDGDEKHQGRGLGRFLLAQAKYLARERGLPPRRHQHRF